MSAAAGEQPHGDRPLIAEANRLMDRNPGYRVEIIGGHDPTGDGYENHRPYSAGEIVTLPAVIGAETTLSVDEVLKAGRRKAD